MRADDGASVYVSMCRVGDLRHLAADFATLYTVRWSCSEDVRLPLHASSTQRSALTAPVTALTTTAPGVMSTDSGRHSRLLPLLAVPILKQQKAVWHKAPNFDLTMVLRGQCSVSVCLSLDQLT